MEIIDKYPCPSEKESFKHYWNMYLPDIKYRDNLKPSHLHQLKILCDLSVEYDEITTILREDGRTYESDGRNGFQIKLRPEVQQLNRVVGFIRDYFKLLGIELTKDTKITKEEELSDFS